MSGKRSRLEGGALTGAVMDSSRKVLSGGRGGTGVGLQQYFTPPEAGQLLNALFDKTQPTLDLAAGDGSLLEWVNKTERYGIEIDRDQVNCGNYTGHALTGDVQKVYPLLRGLGATWTQIVVNPPFGLEWSVPGITNNRRGSSTLRAFQMTTRLLAPRGQAAFICGRDRFAKELRRLPEANQVWAKIEVDDFFDGVDLPIVMLLLTGEWGVKAGSKPVTMTVTREELVTSGPRLLAERDSITSFSAALCRPDREKIESRFFTAAAEHRRRTSGNERKGYDLTLSGQKIQVRLGEYSKVALGTEGWRQLNKVTDLNGLATSWVALNPKGWREIVALSEKGCLSIDPALTEKITTVEQEAREELVPLYAVRPQQRLGYLTDIENIKCVKSAPDFEYQAGESYPITTNSKIETTSEERPYEKRDGTHEIREFRTKRRVLEIRIGEHAFSEARTDVQFLLEHFEIPDPGDIADQMPAEVERAREVLDQLTADHDWIEKELAWKGLTDPETGEEVLWQKEDLARIIVKGRAILGWEQGGGKSLGLLSLALGAMEFHGLQKCMLMVIPQDLLPQWAREAKRFYGIEFEVIDSPAKAREVKRRMRRGEEGFFVTWYEALSITGAVDEPLPDAVFTHDKTLIHPGGGSYTEKVKVSSEDACPSCGTGGEEIWVNHACRSCGYVHKSRKIHSIGKYLSTAFRDGVVCVDEVSEIRGLTSKRGKAVRSLRGKCRFGGSGTPIANYISDAFNALWWATGGGCVRFPYGYHDRSSFEDSFAVIEQMHGSKSEGESNVIKRRKVLPKVTNVSQLWRLLAATMVRRRQEHMGNLVPRSDVKVEVPMGTVQNSLNKGWLQGFAAWFEGEYPDHPLVEANAVERFAPAIGLLAKLEAVATMPTSDPHTFYAEGRFTEGRKITPWTPAALKALELAMKHVREGEKVLIGSSRIDTGHFLATRLRERGVRAAHIVEHNRNGGFATKNPRKRAKEVQEFANGPGQVLCVGIEAMKLGHDLAAASVAIVLGMPWSHASLAQFQRRVHRLTSPRPVTIYSIVPKGTLAEKKYQLLSDKSAAADLALDGQLVDEEDEPIDWARQVKELRALGLAVSSEDTVDEDDIRALWQAAEGPYAHILPPALPPSIANPQREEASAPSEPERDREDVEFTPFAFSTVDDEDDNGQLGFEF
ncbi:MAG: DEAD/DEAH box helicase [Solirubrobacterales bacterium]|nr:DEAD/DEAH box helicase [Solirubrobacterales bacterium]